MAYNGPGRAKSKRRAGLTCRLPAGVEPAVQYRAAAGRGQATAQLGEHLSVLGDCERVQHWVDGRVDGHQEHHDPSVKLRWGQATRGTLSAPTTKYVSISCFI